MFESLGPTDPLEARIKDGKQNLKSKAFMP